MAERASLFVSNPVGVDGPITAEDARLGLAAGYVGSGLVTARSGFRPAATAPGLVTATSPTPNGFVHVAPFQRTHQSLRYAGVYIQTLDTIKDIDVLGPNPADPTNIRHDLVIIHQQDVAAGEADSLMRIRYVVGTPAASPSDPSLAAYPEFRKLARVRVAAGTATITSAMIDDLRADGDNVLHTVASGGLLPINGTTQRAAIISPYAGMPIVRTDRSPMWVEIYDGAAWRVQGVAVCTSTADRDSAITNPHNGLLAITTDTYQTYRYDGTWKTLMPASARSAQTDLGTVTSTSYTADRLGTANEVGAGFVAPPSGKVQIAWSCGLFNTSATPFNLCSFEVRAGFTVGAGAVVQAASDSIALQHYGLSEDRHGSTDIVSGLTPGASYNVQLMYRTQSDTMTANRPILNVTPQVA